MRALVIFLLASPILAYKDHKDREPIIDDFCKWDVPDRFYTLLNNYNVIITNTFGTNIEAFSNGVIDGRLYVGKQANFNGYTVNSDNPAIQCDNHEKLLSNGITAASLGAANFRNVSVWGGVTADAIDGNQFNFKMMQYDCTLTDSTKLEFVDKEFKYFARNISQAWSKLSPTHKFLQDQTLVPVTDDSDYGRYVIQFPVCDNGGCQEPKENESPGNLVLDPVSRLWTGLKEGTYPKDKRIIFNIPVTTGKTYTITANPNANELSPCQAIFHFYPSNITDTHVKITIVREEADVHGLIFAPFANILDGSEGSFSGQLIAANYALIDPTHAPHIRNFRNLGCVDHFDACWPHLPHEDLNKYFINLADPISTTTTVKGTSFTLSDVTECGESTEIVSSTMTGVRTITGNTYLEYATTTVVQDVVESTVQNVTVFELVETTTTETAVDVKKETNVVTVTESCME